jgi:hypothetical protein
MTAEYSAYPPIPVARARLARKALVTVPALRGLRPVVLPLVTAAAALLVWQIVVTALRIPAVILPTPLEVADNLRRDLPVLLRHAMPTTLDTLMAFFTASVLGVGLAIAITYSPLLRDMLYPNLVLFQLIPKVALAPLFVVWLGIGSGSRVAFATFVSFFSGRDFGRSRLRQYRGLGGTAVPLANRFRIAMLRDGTFSVRTARDLQRHEDRDNHGGHWRNHRRIHLRAGRAWLLHPVRQLADGNCSHFCGPLRALRHRAGIVRRSSTRRGDCASVLRQTVTSGRGQMTMRRGIPRRDFLAGTATASAALLPMSAVVERRNVKFTLAWLAQGNSVIVIVARSYLMEPGPDPEAIFINRFAGKIKLGTPGWNDVRARVSEFDKYLS